eukprot:SAG31_NODE_45963_length_256_cov_0.987261_1_plen_49_part_10
MIELYYSGMSPINSTIDQVLSSTVEYCRNKLPVLIQDRINFQNIYTIK